MKIFDFYTRVVASMGMTPTEEGYLSLIGTEPPMAVTIDSRRLCLPTDEILREKKIDHLVCFHPLSELTTRGESEVMRLIKQSFVRRFGNLFLMTLTAIHMQLMSKEHLSPAQAKWLSGLNPWSEKGAADVSSFLKKLAEDPTRVLTLYVTSGGLHQGKPVNRRAVVDLNILEELNKEKPYGATLAKRDRLQLIEIVKKIMPKAEVEHAYDHPDSGTVAPRFAALAGAVKNVFTDLNAVAEIFKKVIPRYENYAVDVGWVDDVTEARAHHFQIPPLSGNLGVVMSSDGKKESAVSEAAPTEKPKEREVKSQPARNENSIYDFLRDAPRDGRRGDLLDDLIRPSSRDDDHRRDRGRDRNRNDIRDFIRSNPRDDDYRRQYNDDRGGYRRDYETRNRSVLDDLIAPRRR